MEFSTLRITLDGPVATLALNRPDKANALSLAMWEELPKAARWLGEQPQVRVVVLRGEGKHFCAGIDLEVLAMVGGKVAGAKGCGARSREWLREWIGWAQESFTAIEKIRVPVIAAIHGSCIGGAVDLIAACDLRYASAEAKFCIKEVDLAVVPDVGTIQRLRHVIGYSTLAELSYSAEVFKADKAERIGLINGAEATPEAMFERAYAMAKTIAAKSPLTVRGIKRNMLYSRDHTVAEGLEFAANWNASALISDDATESLNAFMQKREAKFAD